MRNDNKKDPHLNTDVCGSHTSLIDKQHHIHAENLQMKVSGHINIENVSVEFRQGKKSNIALSDTTVDIKPGEFVCLLGPSGCVKSTLLNVLAGFIRPASGRASLDRKEILKPGPDRSMVFQHHSLLPWKTVYQNIKLGPDLANDIEASKTADYFLGMVGLSEFQDHYPDQLSGGMQQRVGIARALATYPKVLLMDEPFGALDYQTRMVMQENLLHLWEKFNTTVVFVTHDVDEAILLSDRILIMSPSPGRVVADMKNPVGRPRDRMVSAEKDFNILKRECLKHIGNGGLKPVAAQAAR